MGQYRNDLVSENDLLTRFRVTQARPDATVGDMFATVFGLYAAKDAYDAFVSSVDARIGAVLDRLNIGASYVSGTAMPLASLLSGYPPSAANVGKYARVTDLYGSVDDVLRCRYDGVAYRWVPQRESFSGVNTAPTGSVTITPLVTPPVLDLTGTLTGNVYVNLATDNAYIGQQQTVRARGVLGLFNVTLTGLVGGGTLPLLAGGDRIVIYTAMGWRG